jgi:hypothetical protein
MHTYTVELRVTGKDLDLSSVTTALKLQPTNSRVKGEKLGRSRLVGQSMWGFDVRPTRGRKDWESLETALHAALGRFRPRKLALKKLSRRYGVCLWCGHFTTSFDGGPRLSPKLLKGLAALGVELILDTYCSGQAEDREGSEKPGRVPHPCASLRKGGNT